MNLPALSWRASPNYSSRNDSSVRLIVVHDCEGSFLGSVSWFTEAQSRVSAHLVLNEDGTQAVQMVSWENKAWHACSFNSVSEGIEAAGFKAKGLGAPEWQALANIVAFRLRVRKLPPVWAKGGVGQGFEQHAGLGAAGGGHHDITSDAGVWNDFVRMVQSAYQQPMPPVEWSSTPLLGLLPLPPGDWKPIGTLRHDLVRGSLQWVQMTLNKLGFARTPLIVDGLDGWKTQLALAGFQRRIGLNDNGIAGPETVAALEKAA